MRPISTRPEPGPQGSASPDAGGHPFDFRGAGLVALPCGALHWPQAGLLAVSDLHLGRSERMARLGGALLPPYEGIDTLARLEAALARTGARVVICLGDTFDDDAAGAGLEAAERAWLLRLMAGRTWVWITGNHDPGPVELGGTTRAEWRMGPLVFRHIACEGAEAGEVSGHYHPKVRLGLGGRRVARPAFLFDGTRLILPAYGTYTGGLDSRAPDLAKLMGAEALAFMTGARVQVVPVPRPGT